MRRVGVIGFCGKDMVQTKDKGRKTNCNNASSSKRFALVAATVNNFCPNIDRDDKRKVMGDAGLDSYGMGAIEGCSLNDNGAGVYKVLTTSCPCLRSSSRPSKTVHPSHPVRTISQAVSVGDFGLHGTIITDCCIDNRMQTKG